MLWNVYARKGYRFGGDWSVLYSIPIANHMCCHCLASDWCDHHRVKLARWVSTLNESNHTLSCAFLSRKSSNTFSHPSRRCFCFQSREFGAINAQIYCWFNAEVTIALFHNCRAELKWTDRQRIDFILLYIHISLAFNLLVFSPFDFLFLAVVFVLCSKF